MARFFTDRPPLVRSVVAGLSIWGLVLGVWIMGADQVSGLLSASLSTCWHRPELCASDQVRRDTVLVEDLHPNGDPKLRLGPWRIHAVSWLPTSKPQKGQFYEVGGTYDPKSQKLVVERALPRPGLAAKPIIGSVVALLWGYWLMFGLWSRRNSDRTAAVSIDG